MNSAEHRFAESEKPGLYERLGLRLFHHLVKTRKITTLPLNDDERLASIRRLFIWSSLAAFVIGALSAWGSVATEQLYPENSCEILASDSCIEKYSSVAAVTLGLTIIEFSVLIWVSVYVVFRVSIITGRTGDEDEKELFSQVPTLLSRAALEIPDPVRHILGIDPMQKVSKKKLLLFGIFYKLKVLLSNVLAKLIMRRVLGKSVFRVSTDFIAVPVTGLWNSLVIFKVTREAILRSFGYYLAIHIARIELTEEKIGKLSPLAKLCCLQAVGNSIVLTQNYHPNMVFLLLQLTKVIPHDQDKQLDNWEEFLHNCSLISEKERYFVMDLLAVAAAFDGKISRMEKQKLGELFGDYTGVYFTRIRKLTRLMSSGRLDEAKNECRIDFEAG